jgi:glycosyltransferase involved in cell wall biosynthesis
VPGRLRDYLDRATDRSCRSADRLITVSAFSRSEISDLYHDSLRGATEEIEVIHNGVIPPLRHGVHDSRAPEGPKYLLYVGSVEPKKNILGLLEAFQTVTRAAPHRELRLMLAGSHDSKSFPIDAKLKLLGLEGKVSLLGHVSEDALEDLYAHALMFIYPSFYEGFGLPPIEAMARGIPTIVSSTSSLPEVVGDAAVTVDPERPSDLARAILELAGDEKKRVALSLKGVQRARAFSWKRSAEKHLALFESLAA